MSNFKDLDVVVMYRKEDANFLKELVSLIPSDCNIHLVKTLQLEQHPPRTTISIVKEGNTNNISYYTHHYDEFRFDTARNYAKSIATREWVLMLDADDRVSNLSWRKIYVLLGDLKAAKHIGGVKMSVGSWFASDDFSSDSNWLTIQQVKMFRNNKDLEYRGAVHEQLTWSLEELNYEVADTSIFIEHIGYNTKDKARMSAKARRNFDLLITQLNSMNTKAMREFYERELAKTIGLMQHYQLINTEV